VEAPSASPQTHLIPPSGSISFLVPAAKYSKFFLFFNGAAGGTTITVTLTYADGMGTANATIPDYYADVPANDPVLFNLAPNLAKWDKNTAINEANHHNINGVELAPLPDKTLTGIKVVRGAEGNLVFWGATGIATSDVAGLGGSGGGGMGGAAGAGGAVAGGATGLAGAGGVVSVGGVNGQTAGVAGVLSNAGTTSGTGASASATTSAGAGSFTIPSTPSDDGGCSFRPAVSDVGARLDRSLWLALGAFAMFGLRRRSRFSRRKPALSDM
jgi:hypothetical protein